MTKIYTTTGKLIANEPLLTLEEAVKKYKYNLMYADLNGADLNGADLRGADLSNAKLNNANLYKANLKNTILDN